ncbi:hypothetical protein [Endozoicomonas ascidiicola]|uniref:hypothetical protein n=1 Tax=Endozoicomonas ascidiicola TaxID=1698521 RepID=UPI0008379E11|nr:hypothetical protein [Endozoicomonas ascidiicola]
MAAISNLVVGDGCFLADYSIAVELLCFENSKVENLSSLASYSISDQLNQNSLETIGFILVLA